jgi:hypothetical protein
MGGPKTTTQKTEQKTSQSIAPTAEAAPYFPQIYGAGADAVQQNRALPVPQEFIATADPHQMEAVKQIYNVAPGLSQTAQPLQDMATKVASGYFLDPTNDPTFQGAVNSAITPVTRALQEQVLPGIVDRSIRTGGTGAGPSAYGGASQDLSEERAVRGWSESAGNIAATMANNSRNAGLSLLPQAGDMASKANALALAPAQAIGAAGTQERSFVQDALSNILQRYTMNQQAPWTGLQPFANLLTTGGFRNSTGTMSGTNDTTTPAPDLATQLLQGGLGAAGMAASLFGAPAGGTSAASALGSIFGGLGGGGANPTGYQTNPWSQFGMFSPANMR